MRDERVTRIKKLLAEGKNVGLLENGNPCLFGPGHWYIEQFEKKDVVIIPGMGSDAAALAVLGKSIIPAHDTRFIMQTAPFILMDFQNNDDRIFNDLSKNNINMIYYMALQDPKLLFCGLRKAYPTDMPCAVVYWAGFPVLERVVHGTIGTMEEKLAKESEKYMGILFIGRFLEGKPYESAMKRSLEKLSK